MKALSATELGKSALSSFTAAPTSLLQRACACGGACAECRRTPRGLQRRTADAAPVVEVPSIVGEVLGSAGQPLDAATRAYMEPRFGHDFSQVRIHADARAADSAQAVNALAYTVGRDIVFGASQYAPASSAGRRLIAHELAHTIQQQSAGPVVARQLAVSRPGDVTEREADAAARSIAAGHAASVTPTGTPRLARQVIYAVRVTAHNCDKTPWDNPTVLKAAELAFDTVWDTDCVRSESLKEEVLRKFDGLHIWCHQDNDKDTPCGSSRRFFGQQMNINLYQPALWDHRNCGPLASTVLHEVVHTTEWNIFQGEGVRADGCEKSCFDFGDGDADKCQ